MFHKRGETGATGAPQRAKRCSPACQTSLNGAVYGAWELIDLGRLAPLDAPGLLLTTLLDGIGR
ncbi:hypothetical protein [Jiangella sp. DSM 45060]|uniref:hypothetical protein n=1 Tax=Jiangella sp. DSM 45060 TaxID=1798224 RepID=UPI00087BE28B|nr:hypothetical protein [Jiangella sp. DSM 45060]SDT04337.1 hypothetical protein SAMN04515669_2616 [Jiangella sp. DSM 45060]